MRRGTEGGRIVASAGATGRGVPPVAQLAGGHGEDARIGAGGRLGPETLHALADIVGEPQRAHDAALLADEGDAHHGGVGFGFDGGPRQFRRGADAHPGGQEESEKDRPAQGPAVRRGEEAGDLGVRGHAGIRSWRGVPHRTVGLIRTKSSTIKQPGKKKERGTYANLRYFLASHSSKHGCSYCRLRM